MTKRYSVLPMYPLEGLRDAWGALYRSVAARVPGAPHELRWDIGARESWLDAQMVLSQACGWPLVTVLRERVRVLGTFAVVLDGEASHLYRSVIVARHGADIAALSGGRAAVNSDDSLSGFISLLNAFEVTTTSWPGEVTWTGSHLASVESVRSGIADVASIDALTWNYVGRLVPNTVDGLDVVARGPSVPCLPLIVPVATSPAAVAAWRDSFAMAMTDPDLADARAALLISGFLPLDIQNYEAALAPLM